VPIRRARLQKARPTHAADVTRYEHALKEEWTRCFGDAHFQYVIDFSGYSPLWDKILLHGKAESFCMWLHNDLRSDSERKVNGQFPHRANLGAMFQLYQYADHLVSVSSALADINREGLSEYAPPEKFTYARNTINYERILKMGFGLTDAEVAKLTPGVPPLQVIESPPPADLPTELFQPDDLRGSIDKLAAHHGLELVAAEAGRRAHISEILPPVADTTTFVTAGRLSPEKNHARLIRAFDLVHQEFPNTRLVILGHGPLRARLDQLVTDRGLHAAVSLPGFDPNPYGVIGRSDCFVLSSDYEGQPMVLLEALVLGLPVITTSFASVGDAFPDGCGLIVEAKDRALADGMKAFLRGDVQFKPFDYVDYNRQATEEFYRAIGAAQ